MPYLLFDRDKSFSSRAQGYALTIQQGIQTFSDLRIAIDAEEGHLLLMEDDNERVSFCTSHSHVSLASDGRVLGVYGPYPKSAVNNKDNSSDTQEMSARSKNVNHAKERRKLLNKQAANLRESKKNLHIPRQSLRQLLLRGTDPRRVFWDHSLVSHEEFRDCNVVDKANRPCHGLKLHFSNGQSHLVSGLIAADGIYSKVRLLKAIGERNRWNCANRHDRTRLDGYDHREQLRQGLNFLKIFVILGIARSDQVFSADSVAAKAVMSTVSKDIYGFNHRKVQWVDGSTRVFSMPYDRSHIMWQLSFPFSVSDLDRFYQNPTSHAELKQLALEKCKGWHSSLINMLHGSEDSLISGHPVFDREPKAFPDIRGQWEGSDDKCRVAMIGDAFHPMSPFKGQGANQALLDAQALGKNLVSFYHGREKIRHNSRCKHYDATDIGSINANTQGPRAFSHLWEAFADYEMKVIPRATVKVLKSRTAACVLHNSAALKPGNVTRAAAAERNFRAN